MDINQKKVFTGTGQGRALAFLRWPVLFALCLAVSPRNVHSQDIGFKTNLLYDAATALNIGVEVSVAPHWSVSGDWVFPWWLDTDKQRAFQLGLGTVEGRYWFSGDPHSRMTGWFAGIYAGGGYYDLEWDGKGFQGELFHTGVSGGFAHTINPRGTLRMEYSLGMGYMITKYRRYDALYAGDDWQLIRTRSGTFHWFGPTRAGVSLVWKPDWKGGRR